MKKVACMRQNDDGSRCRNEQFHALSDGEALLFQCTECLKPHASDELRREPVTKKIRGAALGSAASAKGIERKPGETDADLEKRIEQFGQWPEPGGLQAASDRLRKRPGGDD